METKEIKSAASILKVIESMYMQFPFYIIQDGKPRYVHIVEVNQRGLFIQSPEDKVSSLERSLFLTNNGNLYQFKLSISAIDEHQIELLYPISLVITKAKRVLKRFSGSTTPLEISNIISQVMVPHDLSNDSMKMEMIARPYIQKLKSLFTDVVFYVHERMDGIARLLADTGKSIFIPDFKSLEIVQENFMHSSKYMHLMKQNSIDYKSEICVPLKYKNIIVFGYIQVCHKEKSDINDYNVVLRVANKISQKLVESDIFNDSKFRTSIMDISSTGLSFQHPQSKHFGKIFSIGGTILFDLFEDNTNLGTFRAVVRNIIPLEKMFRIGCQFFHISEEDKALMEILRKYFPSIELEDEMKHAEIEKFRKEHDIAKPKDEEILDGLLGENDSKTNIPIVES